MKQELINKLSPNCLLPFSYMVIWIDNILFNNDPFGAVKLEVKNRIRSDGRLDSEGWDILIHNATFESGAPVNGNAILTWIMLQGAPTCNQFKIIIQSLKLGTISQMFVTVPVLDSITAEMKVSVHDRNEGTGGRVSSWVSVDLLDPDGVTGENFNFHAKFFKLFIKNFDYIKDCNPYLVIERYTSSKFKKNRKGSWKRDRILSKLNGEYQLWGGGQKVISYVNGYRPNEIPITSGVQEFDIYPENYVRMWGVGSSQTKPEIPRRPGHNNRVNVLRGQGTRVAKVSLRLRIGMIVAGEEILSKPLNYFSIFATLLPKENEFEPPIVKVGYSKL